MFQTFACKLKAVFESKQVQSSGNRSVYKELLVWYAKIAINKWRELGAEVVIPNLDPRNHNAHNMGVDIMIVFDLVSHLIDVRHGLRPVDHGQ